jgi:formate hydrogenlyase subunit 4
MWLFLMRRFRLWLILTVVVPLATGLLRRIGQALERRNGPSRVSRALLRAGDLADRTRARLRGGRRRR